LYFCGVTDKDIQWLIDLAEDGLKRSASVTKEEALAFLVRAGILDENGEPTAPYKELAALEQE
jgi:hypothetical protein